MAISRRSLLRATALSLGAVGLGSTGAGALSVLPSSVKEVLSVAVARPRTAGHRAALARFDDTHAIVDGGVELLLWPGDLARLQATGMPFEVTIPDLLAHDRDARAEAAVVPAPNARPVPGGVTDYRDLQDFYDDFDLLVTMAEVDPDLTVEVITLPNASFEGRTIKAVEIYRGDGHDGRGVAYIDGCHHAREWPAAEYCSIYARWLVETDLDTGAADHERVVDMLDAVRVRICPVVNVDGFVYSRSWAGTVMDTSTLGIVAGGQGAYVRKTQRNNPLVTTGTDSDVFYGVDPNRNYAYLWGGTTGSLVGGVDAPLFASTSANPLDQTYYGLEPFSEPETDNNRQFFLTNNVITYLSNHTQGRLILRPWGHTEMRCPDEDLLVDLGERMSEATEHDGLVGYESKIGLGLYPTLGTSNDWAYAATGTLGYVIENSSGDFHPEYSSLHAPGNVWPHIMQMFLLACEEAAEDRAFGTLTGQVLDADGQGVQASLVLTKSFETPFADLATYQGTGQLTAGGSALEETIAIPLQTRPDGTFRWHINPSTRPIAELEGAEEEWVLVAEAGGASAQTTVMVGRDESLHLELQLG